MTKKEALAKFLELDDIEEIEKTQWDTLKAEGNEYLVLTDEEAEQKAADYIKESIWAFNPSFLQGYLPDGIGLSIIEMIQEKCESANEPLKAMIDDLDLFVEDAIGADGRGHFLNQWDGEENEQDEYFIYQQ